MDFFGGAGGGGGGGGGGGVVLQAVAAETTKTSTTNTIPYDDTIPQSTEGAQLISQAFTPISASSKIYVLFRSVWRASATAYGTFALFVDSETDARDCVVRYGGNISRTVFALWRLDAGSTSARTYKIRFGGNTGTAYNYDFISDDSGGVQTISPAWFLEVAE